MRTESLHRRAKAARSRAAIRSWEYRQRAHAKGTWFRLRRLLTDARRAYSIPESEAVRLLNEGYTKESVGAELEPKKAIFVVGPERIESIANRHPLRVGLGADFLEAPYIVLELF